MELNSRIFKGIGGVFTGGNGILIRNLMDGLVNSTLLVVPAVFLTNDIVSPSTLYPGDPRENAAFCPNDGEDGFGNVSPCPSVNGNTRNPWNDAVVHAVVGSGMPKLMYQYDMIQDVEWKWGVFYPADSNSVTSRCRYLGSEKTYDCPGGSVKNGAYTSSNNYKGAGYYKAGNPYANPAWGGGVGCHFAGDYTPHNIDQTDAYDTQGGNIVQNADCQCNMTFAENWDEWVDHWLKYTKPKPEYPWMQWFGKGKAPSFAVDFSACWVDNPRDMIKLQNALWVRREEWNNQRLPTSNWTDSSAVSQRPYWGWNEVPVDRVSIHTPANWDALVIKLPAAICGREGYDDSVSCLSNYSQTKLELDLVKHINMGFLTTGFDKITNFPSSDVVFLREQRLEDGSWEKVFYCESWKSPSGKFQIVFDQMSQNLTSGACYLDTTSGR
jgi:hypothetical protein